MYTPAIAMRVAHGRRTTATVLAPRGELMNRNTAVADRSMSFLAGVRARLDLRFVVVVCGALLLFVCFAAAQTNRGGISGTVFDGQHSAIAGATVVVKNLGTNQTFQTTTSKTGGYTVSSLDPVLYSVTVSAPGFKTTTLGQVKVNTAIVTTANMTLQPGAVNTEVTVDATPDVAIDTSSGTLASTVSERQLTDVPLVNRSVLDLAMTQPNVMGDAGSEDAGLSANTTVPGYNLSINGSRPGTTQFIADGANNTGVSLARTMVSFSPEEVQEFTVQTSAYSAEYGNTGGGVVIATTKSGTNQLHGSALWYNRNPYFAAPNYVGIAPGSTQTAATPPPTLKYNQFAFTAGGPVYIPKVYNGKNKTFWFFAFEPRYRRDHLDQWTVLPSDAMRKGDFSNTVLAYQEAGQASGPLVRVPLSVAKQFNMVVASDSNIYQHYSAVNVNGTNQLQLLTAPYAAFPNNVIPQDYLNASAQKAMQYIHAYGGDSSWFLDPFGRVQNLYDPRTLRQDDSRYTVRVDHNFSDRNLLNGRYTATPLVKTQFTPDSPTTDRAVYNWAKQATLAYTHMFSSHLFNDLRLNYTRGRFSTTTAPQWDLLTGENLNTQLGLPSLMHGGVPTLPFIGGEASTDTEDIEERYTIDDTINLATGNMTWKIGGEVSHALQNVTPLYGAIGGFYNFATAQTNANGSSSGSGGDSFASFIIGTPEYARLRPTIIKYYYRWNSFAGFVQNDWKVRPNLTLNLGLRYQLDFPRTEKYNHQGSYIVTQDQAFTVPNGGVYLRNPNKATNDPGLFYPLATITVPTYQFAGKGGRSQYLYPVDYKDLEPRLGFAWAPGLLTREHLVLRGGYGISHMPPNGQSRVPNPDYSGYNQYTTGGLSQYALQLGVNNPELPPLTPDQYIFNQIPDNGSINYSGPQTPNSLYMAGYVIAPNMKTPYSQNWNLALDWAATNRLSVEFAYVGNRGTHLFSSSELVNPRSTDLVNWLDANGIDPNSSTALRIVDPLNRQASGSSSGCTLTYVPNPVNPSMAPYTTYSGSGCNFIQPGTLASKYVGFNAGPYQQFDTSNNSIRHAAYVNVVYKSRHGLMLTSNYTFGKSIDDGIGPNDKFVLTTGQNFGEAALGAPRSNDRSVSMFDQRHVWNTTFIYDLPFGRGRALLSGASGPVDAVVGGWTISGIQRIESGYPAWVTLTDNNQMGDPAFTHTIRPDIVPGVPLKNPLYDPHCPTASACQPYLNPAAFERPALGTFGNAPRTLDSVRGPWLRFFDGSVQKSFHVTERVRLQLRADLLNAFNHPNFLVGPNNTFTDFMSQPTGGLQSAVCITSCNKSGTPTNYTPSLTYADYNTWATANSQPLVTTSTYKVGKSSYTVLSGPGLATYQQINNMVNGQRVNGVLPGNFFTTPVPSNFMSNTPQSFDITTLNGYKLFRLRQAYNSGFGKLYNPSGSSRYMQLGVKIFF